MSRKIITPVGTKLGKWIVTGDTYWKQSGAFILCTCECGTKRHVRQADLRIGASTSCGCTKGATLKEKFDQREHIEQRFWSRVKKTKACWNWAKSLDKDGYGRTRLHRKHMRAHRVSWELCYGPVPDGMYVCHKCDNPACVRPTHLFLGTVQDNNTDCKEKGRQTLGVKNGRAKLTETQVLSIRKQYARGNISQQTLADNYKITPNLVSKIVRNQLWKHI